MSNHKAAYAMERAKILFGGYRRGDANDPETYVASIAAVLASFDADIIREVTDPRTGISTAEKFVTFMPNSGELKAHCDAIRARKDRLKHLATIPRPNFNAPRLAPPEAPAGHLANVFVPDTHARYPSMVEWVKTADDRMWKYGKSSDGRSGIWVGHEIWDQGREQTGRRSNWETVAKKFTTANEATRAAAEDWTLSAAARKDMQDRQQPTYEEHPAE